MTQLNEIALSDNRLTYLNETVFNGLVNLQFIRLENNRIASIDERVFNEINNKNFMFVYLSRNPIALERPDQARKLCSRNKNCFINIVL